MTGGEIKKKEEAPETKPTKAPKKVAKKGTKRSTVLLQASAGRTYADVLGILRKDVDPDVSNTLVVRGKNFEPPST